MNEKFFWWGPRDPVSYESPGLWFTDIGGSAMREYDPNHGAHSIARLLGDGYVEISWRTAQAMGAPF